MLMHTRKVVFKTKPEIQKVFYYQPDRFGILTGHGKIYGIAQCLL
jgi:hypothetical protein